MANSVSRSVTAIGLFILAAGVTIRPAAGARPGIDWPSFRGIRASGTADGFRTPTSWDVPNRKNVRWKTPIEGLGHSSPIVWGNRVCVTTATSGKADAGIRIGLYGDITSVEDNTVHTWKLICLDKASGRVAFERTLHTGVPVIKRHLKSTHANSTLATDGTYLVAMLGSEGLHTFDMNGALKWKKDLGVLDSGFYMVPAAQWEFASSPIIHDGVVIIQADVQKNSFIAAFDVRTGKELWRTSRADVPTFSTPTVYQVGTRTHVVVNGWRHIGAYDFQTGKEIWRLRGGGDIPVPTPVVGHGLIFITNAHGPGSPVYAIRETATGDVTPAAGETANANIAWSVPRDGAYMISPVLYGGLLYVSKNNGVFIAFDAKTGERVYQERLGNGTTGFTASLVAADGKAYFTSEEGDVFVVKAGRTFELLATNPLGEIGMATPAISEGVVYFRTSKSLIAIGESGVTPALAQQHEHAGAPAERLGKVHFETSCNAAVRDKFDRGVALLHSFWYSAAIDAFAEVAKLDPKCAMAHWGIALTVWGNPFGGTRTPATISRGAAAVEQAKVTGAGTPRERDYVAAVETLYSGADRLDQPTRALAYERAMEAIVAKYPSDSEAAIFYAVALDAAASPTDQTYAKQLKAAAILEKALAKQPNHPGVSHYLIHSYDYPPLAAKGLSAARRYAQIAPDAPHALHMPSHIFTRVGAWQDSIDSNAASAAAARRAKGPGEELHALDYQVYAYLQLAQDGAVTKARAEAETIGAGIDAGSGYGFAALYAMAAIPARATLERGAWVEAAALTPRSSPFPHADAITWFARALGAARLRQPTDARKSLEKLAPLADMLRQRSEAYWAGQVEIQRKGAEGWILHAEGKTADGLALVKQAADDEDATEKSAVTPGSIVPARELLGELLLDAGRAKEALVEFERTMKREPGRFRALASAMRAAESAGDRTKARKYASDLLALAKKAAPGRPEITEAKRIVGRQ